MTDYAVPEENSALIQALKQVLSCPIGKALGEIRLHEFEQCRYLLRHEKGPVQQVSLSFSAGQQLPKRADSFVADALRGLAQLTDPMDGYQLTLKVPLEPLRQKSQQELQSCLKQLAGLRKTIFAPPVRTLLEALAQGKLLSAPAGPVHSRPGQPFFLKPEDGHLLAVFPLQRSDHDSDVVRLCFIQNFIEAQRQAALRKAPRCSLLHAGQPAPISLTPEQQREVNATAGYLTLTILPQHVPNAEHLDKVAWMLITFYAFMDQHVTSFKVHLHGQMRRQADALLLALDQARIHPGTQPRTAAVRTPVRLASKSKYEALGAALSSPSVPLSNRLSALHHSAA